MRYGLVALSALGLLSFVQWMRDQRLRLEPTGKYLIGVAPNFAAAIAITFVLLSFWVDQRRDDSFASVRYRFFVCASISGLGLIGWELIQKTSERFVFDPQDVLATLVGIAVAALLFFTTTPRAADRNDRSLKL